MSSVNATDRGTRIVALGTDTNLNETHETSRLQAPDVAREGGLPNSRRPSWNPFSGQLIKGAAMAALVALSLPLMTGCGMADTPREPTRVEAPGEVTAAVATVRGQFVEAPAPGSTQAGVWLMPLKGQTHFEVDGQRYERLYIGLLGTPSTDGLTPGGLGDVSGPVLAKALGDTFIGVVDGIEAIVHGLPRDMQGTVQRGVAPGGAPGTEATDLFLALDTPVWLNGKLVSVVHLGAADAPVLKDIVAGDQLTIGGRIDASEDGARLASSSVITAQHYAGSDVQPPKFDGQNFIAAGGTNETLPAIHLPGGDARRSNVVVIDAEMGVAHQGTVGRNADSQRFDATLGVQVYLQGGPIFAIDAGTVLDQDGRALEPRSTWVAHGENGDVHHGWYLHEATNTLFEVSFFLDADGKSEPAAAMQGITLSER